MRALVVVPTYQEVDNIDVYLRRTREAAPNVDILLVDDNSPDGTADRAAALAEELGSIEILRRPAKTGLGGAYRDGFGRGLEGPWDVLVQMDADLSHDPAMIPALCEAIESGADVAIGSRYVPGGATPSWPLHRRALSKWGNRYATTVLGLDVRDATSGFRAYRSDALHKIDVEHTVADGYAFQMEVARRLLQQGCEVVEVPIIFLDRTRGTSKMSPAIMAESLGLVTWWAIRDRFRRRR